MPSKFWPCSRRRTLGQWAIGMEWTEDWALDMLLEMEMEDETGTEVADTEERNGG